ncbi:MAG TPA: DUF3488 and transglutaminase-like domain-containing protein [Chloroflexia bacterium]|nr:DUF3488 and transglutaminase-like domain-containing protein [Chloroflexia bacterium]
MARYLRLREGWLMVGLVALMLFSLVWSIQRAGWSDDLFILTPITLAGLLTALVLSKVRGVPRLLLHLTGMMAGVALVLWETANLLDDPRLLTIQDRVQDLVGRIFVWFQAVTGGGLSDDLPLFVLSLAILTWLLAYASTWFIFRSRWLWWALVPNGIALVINISYSAASLGWYFILFMLTALLLMVRFNMMLHEERWERERVNYSPGLSWNFLRASSVFALVVAVLMWYMPTQAVNQTLSQAWDQVNGPWQDLQERWSKAFANVPGSGNFGYSSFNDSFRLGGNLNLGDSVALRVHSDQRLYWRAKTFDYFDGSTWKTTAQQSFHGHNVSARLSLDAGQPLHSADTLRQPVTATVEIVHAKDNLIFAPLRPAVISLPSRLVVSWKDLIATYNVPGYDPSAAPLELQHLLSVFAQARREALLAYNRNPDNPSSGGTPIPDGNPDEVARIVLDQTGQSPAISTEIDQLRDRGLVVNYFLRPDFSFSVLVNGQIPIYDDLSAVYGADHLAPNQQYTIQSLVTTADKESLRAAGDTYPQWVTDRYLEVQRTLPDRVRLKAQEIVDQAGATTAYDKAVAIQNFLRTYKYNTHITQPPADRDYVDYFLFDGKEGYCEYYSSAMVIMLRTLGIPAREATGYAPGEYNPDTHVWTIRESSSHAWPEVYFPNAGWVEFEPTPSQSVIDRPDSQQAAQGSPTPFIQLTPQAVPTRHGLDDAGTTPTPGGGAGTVDLQNGAGGAAAPVLLGLLILLAVGLLGTREWLRRQAVASGRLVLGGVHYYERLLRLAWWVGVRPRASDTPFEYAEQLSAELPESRAYVMPIAQAYVHERFGQHRPDRAEQAALTRAWTQLRSRLLRRLAAARRWLARG